MLTPLPLRALGSSTDAPCCSWWTVYTTLPAVPLARGMQRGTSRRRPVVGDAPWFFAG